MVSYNNGNVVQCLRQYDMFANSLNLVKTIEEKNMIIKQLTKLENKILELTNETYEEEYNALANKECSLIEEEQSRLNMLIELINQRLSYIEKRCNNHYQLTGDTIDINDILGVNELDNLENRLKIIDKYSKNIKLEKDLKEDVESLNNKINLASEKIDINKSLNQELEKSFILTMKEAFEKCNYFELDAIKDDIEYAYYETEKSLTLAELNLETAKTSPMNVLSECQNMFDEIKKDYVKYKEKLNIIKLIDTYERVVETYEDLLQKRKEINEYLRYIKDESFLNIVIPTINKQYNTITLEQQDVNTFNDLTLERERKLEALAEIDNENNSESFQEVLEQLIKNEQTRQAKLLEEQKKIEEEEKKKRLETERKKQEEILKRQKIIEDARKKEMEKRTKELLEQQQRSVLQLKKKDTNISFETIKDISNNEEKININKNIEIPKVNEEEKDKVVFQNKVDIEKDLFDEFNKSSDYKLDLTKDEELETLEDNKLPNVSIDEYMKNFKEDEISENEISSLFTEDDLFPNIPI